MIKQREEEVSKLREEQKQEQLQRLKDALLAANDKESIEAILVLIPDEEGESFQALKTEATEKMQNLEAEKIDSQEDWQSEYHFSHRPDEDESEEEKWHENFTYSHREESDQGLHEWSSHVDESSGHVYYQNNSTGETTWEKPEGFVSSEKATTKKGSEWAELTDPESGHLYYYNNHTGESRWDKPHDLDEEVGLKFGRKHPVDIFQRLAQKI